MFACWCRFMAKSTSFCVQRADSSRCEHLQSRDPQKVVRGTNQAGGELGLGLSDETGLPQSTDGLHPAEDLLDAFALSLAHDVAAVRASRPGVTRPSMRRLRSSSTNALL